jgi:hypothetical protein
MVLLLLGILLTRQLGEYRSAAMTASAVRLALQIQDAVHLLQRERGLTNGLLGGENRFRVPVRNTRRQTDVALEALHGTLSGRRDAEATAVQDALGRLADLAAVRVGVDDRTAERAPTFGFYTDAISALNNLGLGLDQAQDAGLRHGLQALYALGDAKEYTDQERGFLNGVFSARRFGDGEYLKFASIRGGKSAALAQFNQFATVDQRGRLDAALRSTPAAIASRLEDVAVRFPAGRLAERVDPVQWWAQMTAVIDQMRTVQQSVGADTSSRAVELQRSAANTLVAYLLLAGLEIAAEVLLVLSAGRSISGPLRTLAREADEVATQRLPEAVTALQSADEDYSNIATPVAAPPRSGAEVRAVALALDRLQSTALAMAGEQAAVRRNTIESLASLGRRNQNLVRRQLSLISEFEREELDPSALANLFELDHLATRMRRNAESLLVLVGRSSPRQWSEPLPVTDVVRAGVSEVEDYRRVMLRRVDDSLIIGSVVNEVAHMLAELIENGLSFSPPDVEVEVYGRRVGQRYLLVVLDQGVGMSPDMLAKANARLRGEEEFIAAPTRFLGHYVVGRLAQRLGAEVELSASPVTGITARLLLPADVLAQPGSDALPPDGGRSGTATGAPLAAQPAFTPQPPEPAAAVPALEPRLQAAPEPAVSDSAPPNGNGHHPRRPGQRQRQRILGRDRADTGKLDQETRAAAPSGPPPATPRAPATPPSPLVPPTPVPPIPVPSASVPLAPTPLQAPTEPALTAPPAGATPHGHVPPLTAPPAGATPHGHVPPLPATPRPAAAALPTTPGSGTQPGPGSASTAAGRSAFSPSSAPPGRQPVPEILLPSRRPPVRPPGQPAPEAGTRQSADVQRTRNGLVKRIRTTDRASTTSRISNPPADRAEPPAPPERSPEEIRLMLSAFRSGHQRGEARSPQPPPADKPGPDRAAGTHHQHRNGPGGPA